MADKKLSELTELAALPAGDDEMYIRDVSEGGPAESKRITIANLLPYLLLAGGTMAGPIAMGTNKITGLGNPTAAQDAATRAWVLTQTGLYLPLAGGTTSGPIKIGDGTYIQIGEADGHAQLIPHLEADVGGVLLKPSAGNRYGYFALFPKGTEDRTQISMYNRDQPTDTSVFSIEVNGDTVTILYENIGTPLTAIAHVHIENVWEFQHIYPINNLFATLGEPNKWWTDIYARQHNIMSVLADHIFSGTVTTDITAGENLVFGDSVYMKSDGKAWKADADGTATMPIFGIVLATINADATGEILTQGWIRDDSWSLTAGGLVYASVTAGGISNSLPVGSGDQVQVIGVAKTTALFHFNPSYELVEIS